MNVPFTVVLLKVSVPVQITVTGSVYELSKVAG